MSSTIDASGSMINRPFTNAMNDISESPFILTLEGLMARAESIKQREIKDLATLSPFVNPSLSTMQPVFLSWASAGFTPFYLILSFTITPPAVCSDSVTRGIYDYVSYLIGNDLSAQTVLFSEKFDGMTIAYSISGNTLTFHVSKS
jgi:hypothetical protein